MTKNVATQNKFADVGSILREESKRKKLQSYIDEAVRCKQKILDENEQIRAIKEAAADDLNIQPKLFNAMVSLFFNNNFDEKRYEIEQLETIIESFTDSH